MRLKTLRAFDEWKGDAGNWSMLLQRVSMGETLKEVCEGRGLAYSLVARHIASTPAIKAEYDASLQIWADLLAQETISIADEERRQRIGDDGEPVLDEAGLPIYDAIDVSRSKLRVDARQKLAGKLYRERYGEREAPLVAVNVNLGDMAREIRLLEERLGIGLPKPVDALLPVTVSEDGGLI